jgi:hypothetical protein
LADLRVYRKTQNVVYKDKKCVNIKEYCYSSCF